MNLYKTKHRSMVLKAIRNAPQSTTKQIHQLVINAPQIGKAPCLLQVYRTVRQLTNLGLIARHKQNHVYVYSK